MSRQLSSVVEQRIVLILAAVMPRRLLLWTGRTLNRLLRRMEKRETRAARRTGLAGQLWLVYLLARLDRRYASVANAERAMEHIRQRLDSEGVPFVPCGCGLCRDAFKP